MVSLKPHFLFPSWMVCLYRNLLSKCLGIGWLSTLLKPERLSEMCLSRTSKARLRE